MGIKNAVNKMKNKVGDIFFPFGNYEYREGIRDDVISFLDFLTQFVEIALCRFEYENLPEEIDQYDLEHMLFIYGKAIFFKDKDLDKFICLPPESNNGERNIYNHPEKYSAKGLGTGVFHYDNIKDFVEIRNTPLSAPSVVPVSDFARHLYDLDRTIEVNCSAQKTPLLLKCSQNQKLTLKNAYMQFVGNMPVIYADKSFDTDSLSVLKTDAPFNAPGLYDLKVKYFNEYLTYLGISNVNYQKKERMVTDEVNRGLGGVLANRHRYLLMRQLAVDKINKKFGLDIKVAFNDIDVSDVLINESKEEIDEGGIEFNE